MTVMNVEEEIFFVLVHGEQLRARARLRSFIGMKIQYLVDADVTKVYARGRFYFALSALEKRENKFSILPAEISSDW